MKNISLAIFYFIVTLTAFLLGLYALIGFPFDLKQFSLFIICEATAYYFRGQVYTYLYNVMNDLRIKKKKEREKISWSPWNNPRGRQ